VRIESASQQIESQLAVLRKGEFQFLGPNLPAKRLPQHRFHVGLVLDDENSSRVGQLRVACVHTVVTSSIPHGYSQRSKNLGDDEHSRATLKAITHGKFTGVARCEVQLVLGPEPVDFRADRQDLIPDGPGT